MNWGDYYRFLMALAAWREARNQGTDGMRAVMHVFRNRVEAGWGDYAAVITKKNQISSMSVPGDSQTVVWPRLPDPIFEQAMQIAEVIYEGGDHDLTRGALYYGNLEHIDSGGWFERNIVAKPKEHPLLVSLGEHSFYA